MKPIVFAVSLLLFVSPTALSQNAYAFLTTGRDLQTQCKSWDANVRMLSDSQVKVLPSASQGELLDAGRCWGFVSGVVESIPMSDSFFPDSGVRLSQYVAVAIKYLNNHPENLHQPAALLVKEALFEAFSKK